MQETRLTKQEQLEQMTSMKYDQLQQARSISLIKRDQLDQTRSMKQDQAEIEIYKIPSDDPFYNYFHSVFKYLTKY